jgi:hypothetical protein
MLLTVKQAAKQQQMNMPNPRRMLKVGATPRRQRWCLARVVWCGGVSVTRDLSKNKCFFCLGRFGRSAASASMVLDEPLHSVLCMGQGEGMPVTKVVGVASPYY